MLMRWSKHKNKECYNVFGLMFLSKLSFTYCIISSTNNKFNYSLASHGREVETLQIWMNKVSLYLHNSYVATWHWPDINKEVDACVGSHVTTTEDVTGLNVLIFNVLLLTNSEEDLAAKDRAIDFYSGWTWYNSL